MKRKLIIFTAAVLIPLLFGTAVTFFVPPQYGSTFLGELSEKYETLRGSREGKLVLIGGSSVAFGVDSELIERYIGRRTVNFGLYATLGTNLMLDLSRESIEKGDIIVVSPESDRQTLSMYFNAEAAWQAADSDMSMLCAMPAEYRRQLAAGWWDYMVSKLSCAFNGAPDPQGVYNRDSFNDRGDINYPRPANIMALGYDPNKTVELSGGIWSDEFIAYLNEYIAFARERGAEVYFSCCPVNELALAKGTDGETLDAYYAFLASRLDCEIISSVSGSVLPAGYFYDSNFHLNDAGVRLRTRTLIEDIFRARGIIKAVDIDVPDPPAYGVQSSEDGEEYRESGFIYKRSGDGLCLTGIETRLRDRETLTFPALAGGRPVKEIAAGAFDGCAVVTLYVPDSVVQFYDGAFSGCTALRSVMLAHISAEGVGVGERLFEGCPEQAVIYLPQEGYDNFSADYFWSRYNDRMDIRRD